jgi:hypothetical protein
LVKRKRGRPRKAPPTLLTGRRVPRKRGAPVKFTPQIEQEWETAIDEAIARAKADGNDLTDTAALRAHMRQLYTERLIKTGLSPAEARRLATREAQDREHSTDFPKLLKRLRERLSRVRTRLGKRRP